MGLGGGFISYFITCMNSLIDKRRQFCRSTSAETYGWAPPSCRDRLGESRDAYAKSKEQKIEIGIMGWRQELTSRYWMKEVWRGDCKRPWKLLQLEKPREECKDRNNIASETLKTASWSKPVFGKTIGKDFTMFKIQNLGAWKSIAVWVHYIRLYPREYQTNADIKICNYLLCCHFTSIFSAHFEIRLCCCRVTFFAKFPALSCHVP